MVKLKILFVCVMMMSLFVRGVAQQAVSRRICDTIHYEFIHDKIIIPVTVNGVTVKYIVDTGGTTGTIREAAVEMKAVAAGGDLGVSDMNGNRVSYQEAILSNVQLSPNYKLAEIKSLIFPQNGFFKELGVVGLLGSDAFGQAVLTFDACEQIMIINYPYRPSGLKITEGVPMVGGVPQPFVDVDFGGVKKPVMFDTGADGLLHLFYNDYEALKEMKSTHSLEKAFGINALGIGGLNMDNAKEIVKVRFDEVNFLGKKFTNFESVTTRSGSSIMGVDMLKYGKVVIDYIRGRFYFFPYEDRVEDGQGKQELWNVGILPVKGHFEVTLVWDSLNWDKVN